MIFDFAEHHKNLKQNPNYSISSQILQKCEWTIGGTGHVFTDKNTDQPFIGIAVVQILDFRLQCSPTGSFVKPEYGTLDKAKYQFMGGRPHNANGFNEDFARLHTLLNNIENLIAQTQRKKDMLPDKQSIRFARNIFEKRDIPVPDSPTASRKTVYLEDIENDTGPLQSTGSKSKEKLEMDKETANWPVDDEYCQYLDPIKAHFKAVPLRVYDEENHFVEPENVNNVLRNAVVEVHFTLHHTYLAKSSPPQDSFRANIEQMMILKRGKPIAAIYTSDPRSGPVRTAIHHTPPPAEEPTAKKLHVDEAAEKKGKEKATDI
ncbi:hypothetical protein DEU56DRAFT_761835 [Suillus clintonianus]|uniref:uncharacterized protein n=1 Tax=Suillus clintonianus TaxID=1904413 RepID=UPI001B86A0EC|nr:uncharacterized protein DEU56DRAFT_761835 [Suillus clintonianus]KAG2114425.1 hypothetical protein DEU56DRAFT_761835 [Suillus clintonianus]